MSVMVPSRIQQFFAATLLAVASWCLGLAWANPTLHVMHLTQQSSRSNQGAMVDYAFHLAQERDDILPGYNLESHVAVISSGENIGLANKAFVELISQPPVKVAILGPFYTSQAKVVAATAKYYNLLQIGYTTTSPVFADKQLYPYYARTSRSTALQNPAIIKILGLYDWRKVATISHTAEYVLGSRDDLQMRLAENNITMLASATYPMDPSSQISQLKESKAKIIISFTNSFYGVRPLCQAYKEKLYGLRYQWIHWSGKHGLSRQLSDWYQYNDGCTLQQVKEAAEGMITFDPVSKRMDDIMNRTSDSTLYTSKELAERYVDFMNQSSKYENDTRTRLSSSIFEAAWALVLGLNASIANLREMEEDLENFTYEKENVTQAIFNSLTNLRYYGATGPVSFDENGDRISHIIIKQMRSGEVVSLGEYDPISDTISWYPGQGIRFQGPRAPYDWDVTVYKEVSIDFRLSILMITLASVGLAYCVICVCVAFKFRHLKLIKLSSPRINSLIALGCGLSYLDIMFFSLDSLGVERRSWMCGIRVWLLMAGFTLAFGSMFSKTWRVHVLFTNKKLQRKVVKDLHLLTFVMVILSADILLLIIWQVVDPLEWTVHYPTAETDENEPGKIVQPLMYMCSAVYINYWSGLVYAFKGLLLIFGIFFAWETRKVRIEALNDSKLIGISVYNVMIMSVISVPLVSLLSPEQASIKFGITSISILVCATLTMVLVYGMKIYLIYTHGNKVDNITVQLPFQSTLKNQTSAYQQSQMETSQGPPLKEPSGVGKGGAEVSTSRVASPKTELTAPSVVE